MKVMYLDESGNHALTRIDPDYPVFVLGGVIVERASIGAMLEPHVRQLKQRYFGREDVILHTTDIIRAKHAFRPLQDADLRMSFLAELTTLMRNLDYTVVACAIRTDAHLARYGVHAADPYMQSLHVLVEQFCQELGDVPDSGIIFAEKRNLRLDRELDHAWERLRRHGTRAVSARAIEERVVDLSLKDKQLNLVGLQLADLVVAPIGRAVLGKPTRPDWEVVESKFRRQGGSYHGHGLVVLP